LISEDFIETLASFELDPLGFVLWAFPWNEPGELATATIEAWQVKFLEDLRDDLTRGQRPEDAELRATESGSPPSSPGSSCGR
jgi:hypothetical protein